jgi:hypothetical protein
VRKFNALLTLAALAAAVVTFAACPVAPPDAPVVLLEERDIPEDFLGFLRASDMTASLLTAMKNAGGKVVTGAAHWNSVQPNAPVNTDDLYAPENWDFSNADVWINDIKDSGIKLTLGLLYDAPWIHDGNKTSRQYYVPPDRVDDYVAYAKALYRRYHQDVIMWNGWNEPDLSQFWRGTQAEFNHLTLKLLQGLEELDAELMADPEHMAECPNHQPLTFYGFDTSPGVSDEWIRSYLLYHEGNDYIYQHLDYAGFHPYAVTAAQSASMLARYRNLLLPYGLADKILNTEFGFNSGTGHNAIDSRDMPAQAIKALTTYAGQNIQRIFWYVFNDNDSTGGFGIVVYQGEESIVPKTLYPAIALWGRCIPGSSYSADYIERRSLGDNVWAFCFRRPDDADHDGGRNILILWDENSGSVPVTITLPGENQVEYNTDVQYGWSRGTNYDWRDEVHPLADSMAEVGYPAGGQREVGETVQVTLTGKPLVYVWDNPGNETVVIEGR